MIRLVGPGGAGKSTIGAAVAKRLHGVFLDLDQYFFERIGDISGYIGQHGYRAYAGQNVECYCSMLGETSRPDVVALSSGFMTYAGDIHPGYARLRREVDRSPGTLVLLPSIDIEACVAETVRRQITRPFSRSPAEEESVIRRRFAIYMNVRARKIETMRPVADVVEEIVNAMTV